MVISPFCSYKTPFSMRGISTQSKDILYSEKIQFDKLILQLFTGLSSTDKVWDHRNSVSMLDCGSKPYSTRSLTRGSSLDKSIRTIHVDNFHLMIRDIDIRRAVRKQHLDSSVDRIHRMTFQWR